MVPSEDEILAMEGPVLTRLAFDLGLAIEDTAVLGDEVWRYDDDNPYGRALLYTWEPYRNITQAREVFFDRLENRGFITNRYAGSGFGRAYAKESARIGWKRGRPYMVETLWGMGEPGNPAEVTEALALLRCACLAVAAQQRQEDVA